MDAAAECKAYIEEFFKCYTQYRTVRECGPPYFAFVQCINRLQ